MNATLSGSGCSTQVPFRERAARAGFQVAFKRDRAPIVREFDQHIDFPRSAVGGVGTPAGIMGLESTARIACDACVIARAIGETSKDVDASLG
jgi:hypothetical protein